MLFSLVFTQNSTSPSPQAVACVNACQDTDVNCKAKCLGNPFPDAALVKKTTDCYNGCGSNTDCRAQCTADYISGVGVPTNSSSGTSNSTNSTSPNAKASSSSVITTASTLLLGAITFY